MASAEVENEECPVASKGTLAKMVAPSLKATEPVGVPGAPPGAITVAVKLTGWPKLEGLAEELTVVEVPICTICVTIPELAANNVSEA